MTSKIKNYYTLTEATTGDTVQICSLKGEGCARLKEMGFCEKLNITKITHGRNIICESCGVKMVVNRRLADQMVVCPV